MSMAVDPDITYGILTDYENNSKIFKIVSKGRWNIGVVQRW